MKDRDLFVVSDIAKVVIVPADEVITVTGVEVMNHTVARKTHQLLRYSWGVEEVYGTSNCMFQQEGREG